MNPERLRRILIRVIGVIMLAMVIGFVVYLVLGLQTGDPSVRALVSAFFVGGILIFNLMWRVWLARRINRGIRGGVMQGYRRKHY